MRSWITSRRISYAVTALLFLSIGAASADLYEYFFADSEAINVTRVEQYVINSICIEKTSAITTDNKWEVTIEGINLQDGELKELANFFGPTIDNVYLSSKAWIALAKDQ